MSYFFQTGLERMRVAIPCGLNEDFLKMKISARTANDIDGRTNQWRSISRSAQKSRDKTRIVYDHGICKQPKWSRDIKVNIDSD